MAMTNKEIEIMYVYEKNWLNTHVSHTDLDIFRAGWEACIAEQAKQKSIKDARKNKKLIIGDFVSDDLAKRSLTGFYCDKGYEIATDGKFLVHVKADYPAEWEGKIIKPSDNSEVDGAFPTYSKVIPDIADMIPCDVTLEDFKIMRAGDTAKSRKNLEVQFIRIGDLVVNLFIIDRLIKFQEAYPNAKLYRHEDCNKSLMLIDGDNKYVFMPANLAYTSPKFEYDFSTKTVCKVA